MADKDVQLLKIQEAATVMKDYIYHHIDCDEFIEKYVFIENKDEVNTPVIKFSLWDEQRRALKEMRENRLCIVLKARQLGFTWLVLARAVYEILQNDGYTVICLSETEDKSKELINRVDLILDNLPDWLIVSDKKVKEYEKQFGKGTYSGDYYIKTAFGVTLYIKGRKVPSVIKAQPSTPGAGRSLTADLVIFDEWAFHANAIDVFTAAYPTMARPTSGSFVGLSTNRRGSYFENIWKHSEERQFHPIFLSCFADPRRDEIWYERQMAALGDRVYQEFPRTAEEALIAGDNVSFPEFSEMIHVCEPFDIPMHWKRIASVDNGYSDPFAWYKAAISEDGTVYIYYEYSRWREEPKIVYSDQARIFKNSLYQYDKDSNSAFEERLDYIVAGKDAWSTHVRDQSGKNIIDYYRDGGLTSIGFIPAVTDRAIRKATLHEYLKPYTDENTGDVTAKLQIFKTCEYLISCLPQLVNDERNPEMVADLSDIDNVYDSLGYLLISHHPVYSNGAGGDKRSRIQKHKDSLMNKGRGPRKKMKPGRWR